MQIAVLAVAGVIAIAVLKQNSSIISIIAECAVIIVILLAIIPQIKTLVDAIGNINSVSGVSVSSLKILMKSFVILAAGSIVSDICRDNSQGALATAVDISVKIISVSCALPVFSAVIEIAASFFNR